MYFKYSSLLHVKVCFYITFISWCALMFRKLFIGYIAIILGGYPLGASFQNMKLAERSFLVMLENSFD